MWVVQFHHQVVPPSLAPFRTSAGVDMVDKTVGTVGMIRWGNLGWVELCNMIVILARIHVVRRIIPLLFKRICPQIWNICNKERKIRNIKARKDVILTLQIKLICIITDFLMIRNGPSIRGISLDFLSSGNRSFLKCTQTRSPSSKRPCSFYCLPFSHRYLFWLHCWHEPFHVAFEWIWFTTSVYPSVWG